MLYPELFKQLESVRWNMERDIPGGPGDASFDQLHRCRIQPFGLQGALEMIQGVSLVGR